MIEKSDVFVSIVWRSVVKQKTPVAQVLDDLVLLR
jgi:hypothetical protein